MTELSLKGMKKSLSTVELNKALKALDEDEYEMIVALYFEGVSEQKLFTISTLKIEYQYIF